MDKTDAQDAARYRWIKAQKTWRFAPTELVALLGLKQIQVKSTIRLINLMLTVQASMV
jgi:hypothetical protein